jgi:hypothetical protein
VYSVVQGSTRPQVGGSRVCFAEQASSPATRGPRLQPHAPITPQARSWQPRATQTSLPACHVQKDTPTPHNKGNHQQQRASDAASESTPQLRAPRARPRAWIAGQESVAARLRLPGARSGLPCHVPACCCRGRLARAGSGSHSWVELWRSRTGEGSSGGRKKGMV